MRGAPGCGKTMLARRLPGILPVMSPDEALDVTRLHSIAGLLGENAGLITDRPFRNPHHNVSAAGLIGGGPGLARPGEVVLANHGVLFMDELPLFRRDVLESLRGPLEDRAVRIVRSGGAVSFPCRFSLVGAMNPCPCGYLEDTYRSCRCTTQALQAYRGRLSGPLLDRFDIHIGMTRLTADDLVRAPNGERSAAVRTRVEGARAAQRLRFGPTETNAPVSKTKLRLHGQFQPGSYRPLRAWLDSGKLTGRGFERVLRVARTIADLEGAAEVREGHVLEALPYRQSDELEEAA